MNTRHDKSETAAKERLLKAAGELFAEKGFHAATVREICSIASTNIASIKYYFKDKKTLYEEAVLYAFTYADRISPFNIEGLDLRQQLREYIESKLKGFLCPDRPHWHFKLIHEAGHNISFKLNNQIKKMIEQRFGKLRRIVAALTGLRENDEVVIFSSASIIGQILFFAGNRIHGKVLPFARQADFRHMGKIVDHIYNFSLAGMVFLSRDRRRKEV